VADLAGGREPTVTRLRRRKLVDAEFRGREQSEVVETMAHIHE
jgi:hypothetical protein